MRQEIKTRVLPNLSKEEQFELGNQLRRAATSVVLNLAEGAYRKSDKDFARFLNQAITSLYEVVACLDLAHDDGFITEQVHGEFVFKAGEVARQINGFGNFLNNSTMSRANHAIKVNKLVVNS